MSIKLDQCNPKLRERILAAVFTPLPGSPPPAPKLNLAVKKSKAEDKLNKTEREYLARLRACNTQQLGIQRITLRLADDTRYTPDFDWLGPGGQLVLDEVKGFMRDDARVKIKVAAAQFPHFTFRLVRKESAGKWTVEVVKP